MNLGVIRSSGFLTGMLTRFTPPEDGKYEFRALTGNSDWFSLWLDLNRDGNFSSGERICQTDLKTSGPQQLLANTSYNLMLAHGSPTGSTSSSLDFQTRSEDGGWSSWTTVDPQDPGQYKYYHLTFDGNLSDRISPFTFYQYGATERMDMQDLAPAQVHRLSGSPSKNEGNATLATGQWSHLSSQIDQVNGLQEVFLNGNSIARKSFNSNQSPGPLSGASWSFGASTVPFSIDEIRLSAEIRSPDWIQASYRNQAGTFNFPTLGSVTGENAFTSASEYIINAETYFEKMITATGNPVAFLATGLPGGITIDPTDGNLSGTPVRAGIYQAEIQAIYLDYSVATQMVSLNVQPGYPQVLLNNVISNDTSSLTIEYEVNATGGDDPEVFILADLVDHGTNLYAWKYRKSLGKQGFGPGSTVLGGLDADQRYYVRIYAENIVGSSWTGKEFFVNRQIELPHLPTTLNLWYDALDPMGTNDYNLPAPTAGTPIEIWKNKAREENDDIAEKKHLRIGTGSGTPLISLDGYNGTPVVEFDGDDWLANQFDIWNHHRSSWRDNGYSAFAISRYTGGKNGRVITAGNGFNWLMGHWKNRLGTYYFYGWVDQGFEADLDFHMFELSHQAYKESSDPTTRIWNDGVAGSYFRGNPKGSNGWRGIPSTISLGAWNNGRESSDCQVGEFMLFFGEIEEDKRLLIEGYLAHKWGIKLPSIHPWAKEGPSFGETITQGVTPVGTTGRTDSPIAINREPANLRQNSATLTGQLVNPGLGNLTGGIFSPTDYPGLQLWLDASTGATYDEEQLQPAEPWTPKVLQEVVLQLDANDSTMITMSDNDVPGWTDKSGNGYDMVAQGSPVRVDYINDSTLKVVRLVGDRNIGGDSLYSTKEWDKTTRAFTMFAVARYASNDWWKQMRLISDRTNNNWLFGFHWRQVGRQYFNGWVKQSGLSTNIDFHVLSASVSSSDSAESWLDFNENTQNPNGASNNSNYYMPRKLQFGGWQSRSEFSTGEIAEFIAFNQVLVDTDRKKVEGYLGHKWSMEYNLPSGHDYEQSPPTDWAPSSESSLQAWYDANDSSSIVTNFVKEWKDSANGNIFYQSDISSRPEYIENGINGMPAVMFDGVENFLEIDSRFGLNKNPDLMVIGVTTIGTLGVDLTHPGDSVSGFTGNSPSSQTPNKAIDNDPNTKYLNYDVNNSGLIVTTQVSGVVNGLSFTSANDMPARDPSSFVLEGSLDGGTTYSIIAEGTMPAFSDRGQRKQVPIENSASFNTYRITFPSIVDFNSSDEMQIAELELLGVPASEEWLSVNRVFQLGSKSRKRILAGSAGSWRFNDGFNKLSGTYPQARRVCKSWVRSAGSRIQRILLFPKWNSTNNIRGRKWRSRTSKRYRGFYVYRSRL